MKTAENVKKVALIFFVILGLGDILSALMMANSYFLPTSALVNRIFNIPFALSSLIYGLSSLSSGMALKKTKILDTIFGVFTVLVFVLLLYLNFFVPDKTLI